MVEEEIIFASAEIIKDYNKDLETLRRLSPRIISPGNINILKSLLRKYGIGDKPDKTNFIELHGRLAGIIRKLRDDKWLVVVGKYEEKKPGRKAGKGEETSELPESLR